MNRCLQHRVRQNTEQIHGTNLHILLPSALNIHIRSATSGFMVPARNQCWRFSSFINRLTLQNLI